MSQNLLAAFQAVALVIADNKVALDALLADPNTDAIATQKRIDSARAAVAAAEARKNTCDTNVRLIEPTALSDEQITSNITPDEHPEYDSATIYAKEQRVIFGHDVYECLKDNTAGVNPETGVTNEVPEWLYVGSNNYWAMFDSVVGSQSSNETIIDVTLTPGLVNAIALLELDATEVRITMIDEDDGVVFHHSESLISNVGINNWYEYYFAPIERKREFTAVNLPPYSKASLRVEIINSGNVAKCGSLIVGKQHIIGELLQDGSLGIADYSRKVTDDFGNTSVIPRASSKIADIQVVSQASDFDQNYHLMNGLRSTPVVWICGSYYKALTIYGYFRDYYQVISSPPKYHSTLEIEGLT